MHHKSTIILRSVRLLTSSSSKRRCTSCQRHATIWTFTKSPTPCWLTRASRSTPALGDGKSPQQQVCFFSTKDVTDTKETPQTATSVKPMDLRLLYRYLHLVAFTRAEIQNAFDEIHQQKQPHNVTTTVPSLQDDFDKEAETRQEKESLLTVEKETQDASTLAVIEHSHVRDFLLKRINEFEMDYDGSITHDESSDPRIQEMKLQFANEEASKFLKLFSDSTMTTLDKDTFTKCLLEKSATVDIKRVMPVAVSIFMVGCSVGITTPVMPFVVENLGLSPGQYGHVVSAFALAKMTGNIPSAIMVERHGRKPYLVYSLLVVAVGAGGIGLATQFEHLYLCRLLTGFGVAALSTSATITMSDLSTPRNRASTMAPVMSAFAAGTALGPAMGGMLADSIGIPPTFYLVGVCYVGCSALNYALLAETRPQKNYPATTFPWLQQQSTLTGASPKYNNKDPSKQTDDKVSMSQSVKDAIGQWAPLMSDSRVRNVVIMNGFYWFSLAGSQMTLLPLMLTDPAGLAMTATSVGKVYMGMSLVQVLGNPIIARSVDRLGKGPAIVTGCTLLSSTMAMLPFCNNNTQMAGTLGCWALGSTLLSTAPVAYVSDTVSDEKRSQAIALLRTAGDVGFLIGATGTGALADFTGNLDVAMQSSAGLLLTATSWFAARLYLNGKLNT